LNPADLAAIVQDQPVVQQVDQQVERLRERLAHPPTYPAPTRDPFRFGQRTEPARPKTAVVPAAATPPANSAPILPHLIAIATNAVDRTSVRSAVLAMGDDLQIVKAGDTYAKFLVRSIAADAVELSDPSTGEMFKLGLQ
jgi:hypothetical protein